MTFRVSHPSIRVHSDLGCTPFKAGWIGPIRLGKVLNVSRVALSRVVNQRAGVSAELAIRLAAALGSSPEAWLNMQQAYDPWRAHKEAAAAHRASAAGGMIVEARCQGRSVHP